jgi:hypothetical protein
MDRRPPRAAIALAALGAGLALATMIVLLVMQLVVLRDSRERIDAQDRKIAVLLAASGPLIESSTPLVDRARRALGPLSRDGRAIAAAAESLPRAEATGRAIAGEAIPLLQQLRAGDVAGLLPLLGQALDEFPRLAGTLRETLAVQRQSRSLQARSLAVQRESLAIQAQTLDRAAAIERRLRALPAAPGP